MVSVRFDNDEFYPVYFYAYTSPWAVGVLDMSNAEFVQMIMLQERWRRMQSDLAERMGYWK